ncbi:MAG TPA: tetratricopeptide repeat protein [Anaeromyxobacter sp.]
MAPDDPPRRPYAWAALVAVAALALYVPTVGHGFVFDDDVVIVKNRLIRSVASLPELVSRNEWSGGGIDVRVYRPLTGVTYALNYAVSGLAPWSYHLANALLHGIVSALVLVLALTLGLPHRAAGMAALLFAVHPIHVEAVSNVIGRKDVLATAFLLAMAIGHMRATAGAAARAVLPILCYAGAMLAKEVGVVGVALVALQDLLRPVPAGEPPIPRRRRLLLYGGYAAALLLYLAAYRAVIAPVPPMPLRFEENPAAHAPTAERVMTAVAVFGKGVILHALPIRQSPDYSYAAIPPVASWLDARFLAGAALAAVWAGAGVLLRRRAPVVLWSFGWYAVALLPASNLLFPIATIFGERLLYLPSVALAVLAGTGFSVLSERARPRAVALGAAAVFAALSVATLRYSAAWADEETLFRKALEDQPAATRVHIKLALLTLDRDPQQALVHIRRSLEISERSLEAHLALATVLRKLGRPQEEEEALRRALALDPADALACYRMGRLAREAGRLDEAASWWRRALASSPRYAPALADLGTWHLIRGDTATALALNVRAVEENPEEASAWYNLGLLYRARGDSARSRAAFERFVAVAGPDYAAEAAATRKMLARGEP